MPKLDSKDISLIRGLKSQGWSNTRIAEERFNCRRQTLEASMKRYDRNRQRFDTKINMETGTTQLVEIKQTKGLSKIHNDGGHIRLGKYGTVSPTGYKSELDNHSWFLYYLGERWNWDYPELKAYRNMNDNRTFKLMHRESGKSVSDVGIYIREFLESLKIGVITSGTSMKAKIFGTMLNTLLNNQKLRRDYGDVLAKEFGGESNKTLGWLVRGTLSETLSSGLDPDFQIATRDNKGMIGSHLDKLYFHDIIQEKFKSNESNESLLITYEEVWQFCADWIGGTGTRKGLSDFYSEMQKRGFKFFYKPALKLLSGKYPGKEDCKIDYITDEITGHVTEQIYDIDTTTGVFESSGCPKWPLPKLLIRRVENLYSFESQMNNNPMARSGLINWKDLREFDVAYDDNGRVQIDGYNLKEFNFCAFFDDASGESQTSDRRAVALMARHKHTGFSYLYDCVVGHTKWIAKTKLDNIANFMRDKERELGIRLVIHIEVVKNQRETYQNLRDLKQYSDLSVKDHNPKERGNKVKRILDGLVIDIEQHKVFIRHDLRFKHYLQEEVLGFGSKKHVDLLDAMDQAHHLLKKPKGNWRS